MAPTPNPPRGRLAALLLAIGVRVLVYAGLALLIAALLGYVRVPSFRDTGQTRRSSILDNPQRDGPGWPHLRGPNFDSTCQSDLADHWPVEGPPVLWVKDVGQGYSGFTAVGGRVWTQRQTLTGLSVLCLDGGTGEALWEHKYGWPYEAAGMYPGPRSTPTWYKDRIFFAGPRGTVGCLHANDGSLLWSLNVNETFGGRGTDFGYAASPTVLDDRVILPVGGRGASIVALNADDGTTAWAAGDDPASYVSALPISFGDRALIVGYLQNTLVLHARETGQLLCRRKLSNGYDEHAALPLYDEPYLMFSGPFRSGADLFELSLNASDNPEPTETLTLKRIWHCQQMSNDVASSALVDGNVYGFDLRDIQSKVRRPSRGTFRCLDFKTGDVLWSSDQPGHASVIAINDRLLLFNDRGEVILARASPTAYEELARVVIFADEICWTAPALDDGFLYLRSPTRAACLYVGSPERLDREQLTGARLASEIVTSPSLDLPRLVGGERDCPADPPSVDELLRWYIASMVGVLGPAFVLAVLAWLLIAATRHRRSAPTATRIVFWISLLLLGVIATPMGNYWGPSFVFTWPVTLFSLHQFVLASVFRVYHRSKGSVKRRNVDWLTTVCMAVFLAACFVYFDLCRRLDLAVMWVFLLGFVPSWPVSLPAANKLATRVKPLREMLWAAAAFSAYYGVAAAYVRWWFAE